MHLSLSDGLELPFEAVTQTFAILAKRGVGKTYTASVMAEEMIKAGLHIVIIDPIGVWWGLRSSADGESPGLPIMIVGGDHGDVPIEVGSGEVLANMVAKDKMSMVIDLSLFRKGEQVKFMTDFAENLYHSNRDALHVILDEADAFAPQRPMPQQTRLLGAIEDIVRRGRARGIGVTMITQRPSVLNKNVLTQIEVLIALRLTAPLDQKAIDEWVKTHAEEGQRAEFMASLPSLPVGTAWFWSPGWLNIFKRVKVRKRQTLDSSSTPKVGEDIKVAKAFADVDIDKIRQKLASTIESIESDDPKVLKKRVKDLERQVSQRPVEVKVKEVIPDNILVGIDMVVKDYETLGDHLKLLRSMLPEAGFAGRLAEGLSKDIENKLQIPKVANSIPLNKLKSAGHTLSAKAAITLEDGSKLNAAERRILTVLHKYPDGRSIKDVAIMSGYSPKGGGYRNALSNLRTKGLVVDDGGVKITSAGVSIIKDSLEDVPIDVNLLGFWQSKSGRAGALILEALARSYPTPMSVYDIAQAAGYEHKGGGFRNALSKLRTTQLIEGHSEISMADVLVEVGGQDAQN